MLLDIVAGVVVVWALVRGYLRGFLYQLGQIGMIAVAWMAGRATGPVLEPHLTELIGGSHEGTGVAAFFLVFTAIYLVGLVILRAFTKDLHEASDVVSTSDRALGMAMGAVKGVLIVYLGFVALIMTNQSTGQLGIPYASSSVGRFVMQHNFFETGEFPRAKALARLGWLVHTQSARELVDNESYKAILEHPKAAVLRSPEVAAALARGDWVAIVGNDEIWDLLDEPEIQAHLNNVELPQLTLPISADEPPPPRPSVKVPGPVAPSPGPPGSGSPGAAPASHAPAPKKTP